MFVACTRAGSKERNTLTGQRTHTRHVVGRDHDVVVAGDDEHVTIDRVQRFIARALIAERCSPNHRQQSAVKPAIETCSMNRCVKGLHQGVRPEVNFIQESAGVPEFPPLGYDAASSQSNEDQHMRLTDRIAFVTGSSRGIGAGIARRLAADGAKLVLHSSKEGEKVKEVAESIRAAGGSASIVHGDLTDGDAPGQVVRDAFAVHGALDILVCNAGAPASGPISELDTAKIDRTLSLNLRAVMLATIEFARLTKSPYGRVVLISSASAAHPVAGAALYSASKAGAEAFIRSAAQELGERGITLNSVQPGMTASRPVPVEMAEKVARWTALRRIGAPDDIADVVAFLASDEARWLTGVTLAATGGQITSATTILKQG